LGIFVALETVAAKVTIIALKDASGIFVEFAGFPEVHK